MTSPGSPGRKTKVGNPRGSAPVVAPERSVIADAKKGDERAWAVLFDELEPVLTSYFRDRGSPDPEGSLGKAFVRLGEGLPEFEGGMPELRDYALTTAQGVLREELRPAITTQGTDSLGDVTQQTEVDLIAQAKEGDEAAWTAIFDDLAPDLNAYFRARRASEPDDLISELFLRLARNIDTFEGGHTQFRAYAFTIAQNLLRDTARRRSTHPDLVFLAAPEQVGGDRAGNDPSAEEMAFHYLDLDGWGEMLSGLSDDQRHVLYLRVVADQTFDQVAAGLDKSVDAVKKIHSRALDRIRQHLGEEEAR